MDREEVGLIAIPAVGWRYRSTKDNGTSPLAALQWATLLLPAHGREPATFVQRMSPFLAKDGVIGRQLVDS
jgi:hypothetical protein